MTEAPSHLHGRVVMVTGAAGGFGRLIIEGSAARGARVVALDVDEPALADLSDAVQTAGGEIVALRVDVTDAADLHKAAARAVEEFGAVDVMVNNAGTMPLAFFEDHAVAADAWNRCVDINLKGVINGISAVYDQMIRQQRGHIVNVSSIYGNQPVVGAAVYGATKAAVAFLTEALRQETQGRIKVTTIRPTGVPATGLGAGVVNPAAVSGILGGDPGPFIERYSAMAAGEAPELADRTHIGYFTLEPEDLVEQLLYAIDQPWGVSISDITVRASGDAYVI